MFNVRSKQTEWMKKHVETFVKKVTHWPSGRNVGLQNHGSDRPEFESQPWQVNFISTVHLVLYQLTPCFADTVNVPTSTGVKSVSMGKVSQKQTVDL